MTRRVEIAVNEECGGKGGEWSIKRSGGASGVAGKVCIFEPVLIPRCDSLYAV